MILERETKIYLDSLKTWENYGPVLTLDGWRHEIYEYPHIHPHYRKLLATIKRLSPKTVCEVGAGAGVVAKYVYDAMNGDVELSCVEGSSIHREHMKENFSASSASKHSLFER